MVRFPLCCDRIRRDGEPRLEAEAIALDVVARDLLNNPQALLDVPGGQPWLLHEPQHPVHLSDSDLRAGSFGCFER
ncbi:MAG TPA: hypothetical protein VF017_15875 [Thermoanaerobaculia bacterium]|nr:hypothetical protein [Thermoanaerobaculia bacterium]